MRQNTETKKGRDDCLRDEVCVREDRKWSEKQNTKEKRIQKGQERVVRYTIKVKESKEISFFFFKGEKTRNNFLDKKWNKKEKN